MNRRLLSFALSGLLAAAFAPAAAADETNAAQVHVDAQEITTSTSSPYPAVSCTSSDDMVNIDTVQLASDTRDALAPILNLGSTWRFPVHIHVMMPGDPLLAKVNREAYAVFADNTTMKIEAVLPSTDLNAREFIQRQFVTALLWEKFFANTKTFDTNTPLDIVPVWLVDGLREWVNDDPDHDRDDIVRHAVQTGHAPTLADISGWKAISHDRLMELWQRAFCYYLVSDMVRKGPNRDSFQQWLATLSTPKPLPASSLLPTETVWQQELAEAPVRDLSRIFTWDETENELASVEVITIPSDKPGAPPDISTLDTVAYLPRSQKLLDAVQKKDNQLTTLEFYAHPSWHSILELYRAGLTTLIADPNAEDALKHIRQAQAQRALEVTRHQKMIDYVNWFEVTKDLSASNSHFQSYFQTAQEAEDAQADPKHPNPIRADLMHVEALLQPGN